MPPKSSSSTTPGQQTLSSFFTARAPPPSRPKRAIDIGGEGEVLVLSSDDDEEPVKERVGKKVKVEHCTVGSELSPIASTSLLAQVPPPPPPPAPDGATSSTSLPFPRPSTSSASSSKLQHFAYAPLSSSAPTPLTAEQAQRREQFAKRLQLGGAGRRRSGYLQKEHYLAPGEEGEDEEGGGKGKGKGKERKDVKGKGKAREMNEEEEEDDNDYNSMGEDDSEGGSGSGGGGGRFARFAAKGTSSSSSSSTSMWQKGIQVKDSSGKTVKYTPLEKQVLELKKANPGVLLVVEVGYKFRFFGEDAEHASRILNIACFKQQHMLTGSIPTFRLDIHVRRLLNAGHKVGVCRQQETAALKKAGDNRSAPFTRALSALYTSATFVDELGVDPLAASGATATLMCIVEDKPAGKQVDAKVKIGLVAVMPSTGLVVYDGFEDGLMRAELETRMLHLQPSELLLQKDLSPKTESMVKHLAGQHNVGTGDFTTRIEKIPKRVNVSQATSVVSGFYAEAKKAERKKGGREEQSEITLDSSDEEEEKERRGGSSAPTNMLDLPKLVLVALSSLITHLKSFSLDTVFLHTSSFSPFASRAAMTLNGNTVANLEILRNSTDFREHGSLISVVDRCRTAMGKRLLRKWVTKPLLSVEGVNARLSAIFEIHSSSSSLTLSKLRDILRTLPDLERGLSRIHFGRASPNETLRVLEAFKRVGEVFDEVDSPGEADGDGDEAMHEVGGGGEEGEDEGPVRRRAGGSLKSELLRSVVKELPRIRGKVADLLSEIDVAAARDNKKEELFADESKYPDLEACKAELAAAHQAMQNELKSARKTLRKPALQFTKVSQEEYLLEVKVAEVKTIVPADWVRINATKQMHRYRSPTLQNKLLPKLEQAKEKVVAVASVAFQTYLQEVASHYELFRTTITSLSTADCLFSLALVALSNNWVRPTLVNEPGRLEIVEGRHPIIEATSSEPFVANSVKFGAGKRHSMVLTGLNMGGKSSLSRSIALIALLSQIGSYVPAESCTSSLFDSIMTRMGAQDEMARGRSTFMVELSETSEILRLATPRSLIILDELGRGTSTNDGQAIAEAVLEYIVKEKRSTCIFVTHYPSLGNVAKRFPESVTANHMACLEIEGDDSSSPKVTFLYKLASGLASSSHGLNVARLAELPLSVLDKAREKSGELERITEGKIRGRRAKRMEEVLRSVKSAAEGKQLEEGEKDRLVELCAGLVAK